MDKHALRCDDCGQFAKANELVSREPWLGGVRHRNGFGCCSPEALERVKVDAIETANRRREAEIEAIVEDYERSLIPQVPEVPTIFTDEPTPKKKKCIVAAILLVGVIVILLVVAF